MNTQDAKKVVRRRGWYKSWGTLLAAGMVAGCAGRPAMIPNSDKSLRRTSTQFAADAAKRAYPAEAPRGGEAQAQAAVDHGFLNRIEVVNLSDATWTDVDLWIRHRDAWERIAVVTDMDWLWRALAVLLDGAG